MHVSRAVISFLRFENQRNNVINIYVVKNLSRRLETRYLPSLMPGMPCLG